ncbi:MAG: hypothetical protein KDA87_08590 [Planctomycetales bacterium]|nr:hypothetical protein [Planctomycetales bacterium]
MDAKRQQLEEKLELQLMQAAHTAAELQALEQGDRVPHFDEIEMRDVHSMDGPIELTEPVAHCRRCRRSFFPSAKNAGV